MRGSKVFESKVNKFDNSSIERLYFVNVRFVVKYILPNIKRLLIISVGILQAKASRTENIIFVTVLSKVHSQLIID